MNIVLGSAFRNAAGAQIDRWTKQCKTLENHLFKISLFEHETLNFRVVAVEGDSTDNTRGQLVLDCQRHNLNLSLVTCSHGQRVFGSTEEPDRLAALSQVGNAILSGVNESDDILIYVESDLLWSGRVMIELISRAMDGCDVVAPLIFAGEHFYDTFVFRGLDGERFAPFLPYHKYLSLSESLPVEVESAGSCLVMKAEVARKCRMNDGRALLGFCRDVREKGYHIFVDPTQRIYHP